MGIAVFLLGLFFAWAVVLPVWSLIAASRARTRAEDAERLLAERGRSSKAFARSILALEWTGTWRAGAKPADVSIAPERIELRPVELPRRVIAKPPKKIPHPVVE